MDVQMRVYILDQNIRNSFTCSHASEEENRTKYRIKNASVNGTLKIMQYRHT
jgi:hypothetical protein